MKAIQVRQFGDPSVLQLQDVPDPIPEKGQVIVSVRAIGINPVETYIRSGKYGPKQFPYIPGNDAAGIVHSVGPGVTRVNKADRVYVAGSISGTYAQLTLADQSKVHPLPSHVTFSQGAAMGIPYGTAFHTLFHRGQAHFGESVLIHGATGGVGLAALQIAKSAGLLIFATGGSDKGRELLKQQGAHHVFDHHSPAYTNDILKLTNNQGVNLILEMLANVNLAKDLPMLSRNGRVMVIGSRGEITINPRDTMAKESDIRGVMLAGATDPQYAAMHQALVRGLETHTLDPIIAEEFPLAEAPQAHEAVMAPNHLGKIVLIVQ